MSVSVLAHRQMRGCESKILWPSCLLLPWDQQQWGRSTKRVDSSGFAVWEWSALGLPLSITCARGDQEEEGQRLFRDLVQADPDGTCAIGAEKAPLLLLWTTPDFFFWGSITMTRKIYAVCEQAKEGERASFMHRRQAELLAVSDEIDGPPTNTVDWMPIFGAGAGACSEHGKQAGMVGMIVIK